MHFFIRSLLAGWLAGFVNLVKWKECFSWMSIVVNVCACVVGIVFAFCSIHTWLLVTRCVLRVFFHCICSCCAYACVRMLATHIKCTTILLIIWIHVWFGVCAGALKVICTENALTDAIAMAVFPRDINSNSAIIVECMKCKRCGKKEKPNTLKMCKFFQLTEWNAPTIFLTHILH